MNKLDAFARLQQHQLLVLDVLARAGTCIASGPDAVIAEAPAIRAELAAVLRAYELFKHEHIFDPAIASGHAARAELAHAMKVGCVAAGEILATHMRTWQDRNIRAEWHSYRPSVSMAIIKLRRHVNDEAQGIATLLSDIDWADRIAA